MDISSDENINSSNEKKTKYSFLLSTKKRIIFARLLDIVVSSIVPLILSLTFSFWANDNSNYFLLLIFMTFIWFFTYFIIIPYFWYGQTVMKWIFRIRLITTRKKLTFLSILTRELIIIFIPWFVVLITDFIIVKIFGITFDELLNNPDDHQWASLVFQIASTFYIFWLLGLMIAIFLSEDHQFFMDRILDLYIIQKPSKELNSKPKETDLEKDKHIHLGENKPGIISDEGLDEIKDL